MAKLKNFTVPALIDVGFRGFLPFKDLKRQLSPMDGGIPSSPGVYAVIRSSIEPPQFLLKGFGGSHKGRKANSPISELDANWVPDASILYFGKASQRRNGGGLWERINEYSIAGQGRSHGHSGGEYIWQLADARELLVAWKVVGDGTETILEKSLILAFRDRYGKTPFANRT